MLRRAHGGRAAQAVDVSPTIIELDDVADPRVDEVARLTDSDARRDRDSARGIFVAEGILVLETAVATGRSIRFVLCSPHRLPLVADTLAGIDTTIYVAPKPMLREITGFPMHRGIIGSVDRWPTPALAELVEDARRVLVIEGVGDHENVGGLFRNAAAFGVDGVVVDDRTADPLYRRAVRVSIGNVMRVPWCRAAATDAIAACRAAGLTVAALTPSGSTAVHDLDPEGRWSFVVGAEGPGLTEAAMDAASHRVTIPMAPGVDSLNVATSAAVALAIAHPRSTGVGHQSS